MAVSLMVRRTATDLSESDAVRPLLAREGVEFDAVYLRHGAFVWRVLRGMGVPDAAVDDAVQDVFLVVFRRLSEFRGDAAVKTWLFEIAYRIACDYRRRGKRAANLDSLEEPLAEGLRDHGPGPAELAEQREQLRMLEALLDRLDDEKRAVLVLADIEGLTAPEIAAIVSCPLSTVYTRLSRARAEMKAAIARLLSRAP
jgi:RNA polymerase sigma-70 factor (ECF subfamily)